MASRKKKPSKKKTSKKSVSKRGRKQRGDDTGQGEFRSSTNVGTALIAGEQFRGKAVQYSVVDGEAIFEGDIVLGTVAEVQAQSDTLAAEARGEVAHGVVLSGTGNRWANCVVPYTIDPALPNKSRVTDAIAHWVANTNYTFPLRTTETDYVTFRPSSGCSSNIGRRGGQQFINLGSGCTKGNAIHEIGHTIGLWHEQSRQDRDSFVTINWTKIKTGFESNFNQHISDGDDVGAYDYGSIMHYPRDAFSTDGSDTITPTNPASASIGQRIALSAGDIAAANSLCALTKNPKSDLKWRIETLKETVKDLRFDTKKEMVLDTRKEMVLDTRKEMVLDTKKEMIKDHVKEVAYDTRMENITIPGRGPRIQPGTRFQPGGAQPFATATPHHAPSAETDGGGTEDAVAHLDAQLQGIAEQLTETQSMVQMLEAQYEETSQLLEQTIREHEEDQGQ